MTRPRQSLSDWMDSPLGALTTGTESALAEQACERAFGDVAVQIGLWGKADLFLQHCRTRTAVLAAPKPADGVDLVCKPESLPLASDSVDLLLLPHTLELSERPQETLREAQRVLVGDGRVVLMCFDPFSLWGLGRRLGRIPAPRNASLSIRRLFDWLSLLGLEMTHSQRYLYIPPVNHAAVARQADTWAAVGRRLWPFASGAFFVVARKRIYTGMPVRRRTPRRTPEVVPLAKPIAREPR
ncbi:MAG: methyltransferase domain-containing protein [Pseudomonadota bacterium]